MKLTTPLSRWLQTRACLAILAGPLLPAAGALNDPVPVPEGARVALAVLGLKQAHLDRTMVGEEFFQNLAAEISSSFIETCPTHRRFIAAWRFPVVMTALDLFFAVRKDTTPVVDYLKNPLAALLKQH